MNLRLYLGGPMTGKPQFNFPLFDAAERDLIAQGHDVVPPADLHDLEVRRHALSSKTGDMADLPRHLTWGEFLANDVRMIADDGIEAIVLLPGWESSRGARLEVFVGRLCGLPIYLYLDGDLALVPMAVLREVLGGVG